MAQRSPQRVRASSTGERPPVVAQEEGESAEHAVARLSRELQEERALAAQQQAMLADMKDRMERLAAATEAEEEKLTGKVRLKAAAGVASFPQHSRSAAEPAVRVGLRSCEAGAVRTAGSGAWLLGRREAQPTACRAGRSMSQ